MTGNVMPGSTAPLPSAGSKAEALGVRVRTPGAAYWATVAATPSVDAMAAC